MLELDFGGTPEKLKGEYIIDTKVSILIEQNKIYLKSQAFAKSSTVILFNENTDLCFRYIDTNRMRNIHAIKREYLNMYEGIQSGVISTTKFAENSDLSMTHLDRIYITRASKTKAEEKFPISEQGYTISKLLDGTECHILLETGASKSFMFKSHYLWCKSLHLLPKFASKALRIQVGNGQFVSVLFIISIMVDIHGHRFEIFTFVLEIHEKIDLVFGIKNIF